MINKIKLGTLFMNGVQVKFNQSTPTQFINGATLELKTSSSDLNYQIEWVSFTDGSKNILISDRNVLSNISYNDLSIQGLISGNTIVTLQNIKYKVLLMASDEYDKYLLNSINLNTLLTPTTLDETNGGYSDSTISSSDSNNLWNWWKTPCLTQTLTSSNNIIRGGNTINASSTINVNTKSNWRLMLSQYNTPPTISDSDTTLGSYTSNIVKAYTITDPDDDLFKIVEMIDSNTNIRTLENQSSKNEFTFTLSTEQWKSLSAGVHTINIVVTDSYGNIATRNWLFNKVVDSTVGTSSALTRPVIVTPSNSLSLSPFDATFDEIISFTVTGGDMVYANEINIIDNSNSSIIVYNKKVESFDFENIIPKNTLINGKTYQIKIRTYNTSGQYSAWSDTVLVKALTTPQLLVTTIVDDMIQTPNPVMQATYYQADNDSVYSYVFNLLKDGVQVDSSNVLLDKALQYQFSNLDNKANYVIELKIQTASGMIATIQKSFYCIYLQSKLPAVMTLINDNATGSVKITTYVRQILGRVYSGDNVTYIDGEWANLHNSTVIWDSDGAFRLDGDWTAKIWARDLEDNDVMLVKFTLDDGNYIQLTRWGNMFSLTKIVNGIKLYELHKTIEGDILSTDELYFFIQNDVDLGLMNFDVKRITDGRSTWFTKSHTEDVIPSYANIDGFLSQLDSKFVSLLKDKIIDGEIMKVRIPSMNDFSSTPSIGTSAKIGQLIIGQAILGDSSTNEFNAMLSNGNYFTRDISIDDSNKLIAINNIGKKYNAFPNDKTIGIRIMVDIPSTTKVSTIKDRTDDCYFITTKIFNLFDIQQISNLKVGDGIKSNSIRYKENVIKFTINNIDSINNTITLISDVIDMGKEFDASESVYINGNPNWNTSNLQQWLNSNVKIG